MTNPIRWRPRRPLLAVAIAVACLAVGAGPAQAATSDGELLAAYQPLTFFDAAERFRPTTVESFLADAQLERLTATGAWEVVDPDPQAHELPGPGSGVWRLNQEACTPTLPLGGLACYAAEWREGAGAPTVYGRVVRTGGRVVLQYWYFYYDNTYSYAYPPSDFIWQAHEGDWEVVNLVLDGEERPLYVGYSQHCLGVRRDWAVTPRAGTHPAVFVAVGSHANQLAPGAHPIDVRCIPPAALAFLRQSGLPLPRDYVGLGFGGLHLQQAAIHEIGAGGPSWIVFPGFWGELQYFHAPPPIGTVALGTSPVGPAYHRVWSDPLGTLATWPSG